MIRNAPTAPTTMTHTDPLAPLIAEALERGVIHKCTREGEAYVFHIYNGVWCYEGPRAHLFLRALLRGQASAQRLGTRPAEPTPHSSPTSRAPHGQ